MRRRSGTMQAYSRVGATDNGACPARHRGDRAHGRAGREQRSGPKQAKVAASGRRMVLARRRVALVRRRTASSRCMVAPARRVDAANDAKCPGDASAWLRRRDGQGGCPSGWHGDTDAWLGETARVRRAGGGRGVARSSGASQKGFEPSSHWKAVPFGTGCRAAIHARSIRCHLIAKLTANQRQELFAMCDLLLRGPEPA